MSPTATTLNVVPRWPCSTRARKTRRPMRPNPLMAMVVMAVCVGMRMRLFPPGGRDCATRNPSRQHPEGRRAGYARFSARRRPRTASPAGGERDDFDARAGSDDGLRVVARENGLLVEFDDDRLAGEADVGRAGRRWKPEPSSGCGLPLRVMVVGSLIAIAGVVRETGSRGSRRNPQGRNPDRPAAAPGGGRRGGSTAGPPWRSRRGAASSA